MKITKRIISLFLAMCITLAFAAGLSASAATPVTPIVRLNEILNMQVNSRVSVNGTSTIPCYRMAAKYMHNGVTTWLGEVYSNSYSKSFTASDTGVYTVTLYARSYPESDSRSVNSSKTVTFYVYNKSKQASIDDDHLLSVPELLVSIPIKIKGNYIERYYISGNNATYVDRSVWVEMKDASNHQAAIIHETFLPSHVSDWANPPGGAIFDTGYNYCLAKSSKQAKTYSTSTTSSATVTLSVTTAGERTYNPYSGSMKISFKTTG